MRVSQKNVRVFHIEIDDESAFLDYFRKNSLLLKEFLNQNAVVKSSFLTDPFVQVKRCMKLLLSSFLVG